MVIGEPAQTGFGEPPTVRVGVGLTRTVIVWLPVQAPLAPTIEYVVVVVGLTTTLLPVSAPGFHVYDVAPLEVSVELPPIQMAVGDALAVTVGFGVTTCVKVIVLVQPSALVAVNV
jgi:hypothetical protein